MTHRTSLTILILLALPTWGLQAQSSRSIYSRDVEQLFAMARDLWSPVELQSMGYISTDIDLEQAHTRLRQGCLYLEAAVQLDPAYAPAWRDLTALYTTDVINDPNRAGAALFQYTSLKPQDQLPINTWLNYSINNLDDRNAREEFLLPILTDINNYPFIYRHPFIYSWIMTQLGNFAWEKGLIEDPPSLPDEPPSFGARSFFGEAFNASGYNDQALARILELTLPQTQLDPTGQLTPEQIAANEQKLKQEHELYSALRWRLRLRNNPYDLQAVLNLIDTLEILGRHPLAKEYYSHADYLMNSFPEAVASIADLQILRNELRFRHLLGAYSIRDDITCINLAQGFLRDDPNNFILNVLLAKSMKQIQVYPGAEDIMQQLTTDTIGQLEGADPQDYQLQSEAAWFFCFINPDPAAALQYSQSAYQGQPDRFSSGILAYAYLLNQQSQQAQTLLENLDPNDVIPGLTAAGLARARDEKDTALQHLQQTDSALQNLRKTAPFQAAILSRHIEQLRYDLLSEITTPPAPDQDLITETFVAEFNGNDLLFAVTPEKAIHCTMNFSTDIFPYDDPMIVRLFLSNISGINNMETDLVLGPDNMIDPHVIITAEIESTPGSPGPGDAETMILSYRYLLQQTVLRPGQSNTVSESLNIAQLRQILQDHPQQAYSITFRAYLDPVSDGNGGFRSRIPSLQPAPVTVTRRGFTPTRVRMDAIYHAARAGTPRERINAIGLAAGLLREVDLARKGRLNYRPQAIEPDTLRQIITENLAHPNPCVSGWSVYALRFSTITAESSEARHLAELLTDSDWFVRFMVVQNLNPIADLTEYFRWAAAAEQNPLLQRQLRLLQHLPWQK